MPSSPRPSHPSQTLELLVRNHPGAMVHIASLFARRAFNLEGILCVPMADRETSRLLLLVGPMARLDQIMLQLEKLHDVLEVRELPGVGAEAFVPQGALAKPART